MHPEVVAKYEAEHNNNEAVRRNQVPNLEARAKQLPPLCYPVPSQNWGYAYVDDIDDGIDYLGRLNGGCSVGAKSCSRISCSYDSAIFLCNDVSTCVYCSPRVLSEGQC